MSDKTQLYADDFIKQMFKFGFFYEQIPPCFTSESTIAERTSSAPCMPDTLH